MSIHKSAPGVIGNQWEAGPQGGLRTINTTTLDLLEWTYRIPDYRLSGAPGWVSSEHYDVTFTPAEPETAEGHVADATEMNRRNRNWQRLQGVLCDRFGLVLREETHRLPVYPMVPDKEVSGFSRGSAALVFPCEQRRTSGRDGADDGPSRYVSFGRVVAAR